MIGRDHFKHHFTHQLQTVLPPSPHCSTSPLTPSPWGCSKARSHWVTWMVILMWSCFGGPFGGVTLKISAIYLLQCIKSQGWAIWKVIFDPEIRISDESGSFAKDSLGLGKTPIITVMASDTHWWVKWIRQLWAWRKDYQTLWNNTIHWKTSWNLSSWWLNHPSEKY